MTIHELKVKIKNLKKQGPQSELQSSYLDLFSAYNNEATNLFGNSDDYTVEQFFVDWLSDLTDADNVLNEKQRQFCAARFFSAKGTFLDTRGLNLYFRENNFLDAAHYLENSEVYHEKSANLISQVAARADAPPSMQDLVLLPRAESLRVRGMRLLVQGEFETKITSLQRAISLLENSVATLREAEKVIPRGSSLYQQATTPLNLGVNELDFADYAEALLSQARSEHAILEGDIAAAANHERLRAEALQRCQAMHLRAGNPLHSEFAKRLSREAFIATQRHDRLSKEAQAQTTMRVTPFLGYPKPPSRQADIFVLTPFREEFRAVYEKPLSSAARTFGLTIKRGDDFFTAKSVIEDIWHAIVAAKILIADCSGRNPNVFYEIGIAHTIGKPVILMTQNADDVPFDLRHVRFIEYDMSTDGVKAFENKLIETIKSELTFHDLKI